LCIRYCMNYFNNFYQNQSNKSNKSLHPWRFKMAQPF
jgi:hypothetical protein